jgi:hypothetical protein
MPQISRPIYAECCYTECRYAECRYAFCFKKFLIGDDVITWMRGTLSQSYKTFSLGSLCIGRIS